MDKQEAECAAKTGESATSKRVIQSFPYMVHMERFPDCPRCGERMQEGVRSGDTLMKIWECRQCGETQAREDFITWSETDCLLAIANEQKNIRVQLIRIADAVEAMAQADHLSAGRRENMENGKKYWCGVSAGFSGTMVVSGIEDLRAFQPKLEALALKLGLENPNCGVTFSDVNELGEDEEQAKTEDTTEALSHEDGSGQQQ